MVRSVISHNLETRCLYNVGASPHSATGGGTLGRFSTVVATGLLALALVGSKRVEVLASKEPAQAARTGASRAVIRNRRRALNRFRKVSLPAMVMPGALSLLYLIRRAPHAATSLRPSG